MKPIEIARLPLGALALIASLGACASDHVVALDQPMSHGMALECALDAPNDTISPFDRCVLEFYQPCEIEVGPVPALFELQYANSRLLSEDDMVGVGRADYEYEDALLVRRAEPGFRNEWLYEYEGGRLAHVTHSADSAEWSYSYDSNTITIESTADRSTVVHRLEHGVLAETERTLGTTGSVYGRVTFTYEGGLLRESFDDTSLERREYTYENRRLVRVSQTEPFSYELQYEYDDDGRLARVTASGREPLEITLRYECP